MPDCGLAVRGLGASVWPPSRSNRHIKQSIGRRTAFPTPPCRSDKVPFSPAVTSSRLGEDQQPPAPRMFSNDAAQGNGHSNVGGLASVPEDSDIAAEVAALLPTMGGEDPQDRHKQQANAQAQAAAAGASSSGPKAVAEATEERPSANRASANRASANKASGSAAGASGAGGKSDHHGEGEAHEEEEGPDRMYYVCHAWQADFMSLVGEGSATKEAIHEAWQLQPAHASHMSWQQRIACLQVAATGSMCPA